MMMVASRKIWLGCRAERREESGWSHVTSCTGTSQSLSLRERERREREMA
jgi:hypothetical protein